MKKKIIKSCAVLMACFTLSLSVFNAYSISAQASTLSVTMNWVIDKVLAKCGIIANASSLGEIKEVLFTDLDTAWGSYIEWCDSNGKDWTSDDAYNEWFATYGGNELLNRLSESRRQSAETDAKTRSVSDDEIVPLVMPEHGGGGTQRTIEKDVGQPIVDAYKQWWTDCGGYYLLWIPSYKELFNYCYNTIAYENLAYLTENHDLIYITSLRNSGATTGKFSFVDLDSYDCFCYAGVNSSYGWYGYLYNDWTMSSYYMQMATNTDGLPREYITVYLFDDSVTYADTGSRSQIYYFNSLGTGGSSSSEYNGLVSHDGMYIKIWKSLDGFKAFSVGVQNVYYSPTYTTVLDNDVTISNDYITTYANQYSYSIVQNEIDNSTTEITEETVNTIVDNSVTNITNNYYYTTPSDDTTSGGDSVSGGDSDDSLNGGDYDGLFDGLLGNLLNLVTELIEFIVKFVVKGLEILTVGITAILNLINATTDSIGDLGALLSAFMPFVPPEVFDILIATVSVCCGLAVIKYFKG